MERSDFQRNSSGNGQQDTLSIVKGKGRGLIILLHGVPGVGKTSTAETIAEATGRPLLPVTCGDIGENATDVEKNLEQIFTNSHRWGCVLLLDEAEVFLTKRNVNDFMRNAMVSVFMRALEFYSGILFLTTNRVGTMDEAFKSRVHISLFVSYSGLGDYCLC
jgi:SpoVK/Ycf46/Vps4 family AAA+-type ATPase